MGTIHLDKGDIIHAQLDDLTGEAAAAEILAWPPGEFTFSEGVAPPARTLNSSWDRLLQASNVHQREGLDSRTEPLPPWEGLQSIEQPEPSPSQKLDTTSNLARITIYGDKIEGRTYDLNLPVMHIGRGPLNEIIVPDSSVSTRHCVLLMSGGRVTVRDLHSSNGTFVNGQQVTEAHLQVNDVLRIGAVIVKFEVALRRPKLIEGATVPLMAPPPPAAVATPLRRERAAPGANAPISYEAIARDIRQEQEDWRPPGWLTLALILFFVLLGFLIVGNPAWVPAWLRFW